jgi:glycosyltransferase involved in cell wall biosynthesis
MKKIGLIAPNLAGSGAEKVVLHLAEMFEKEGNEVHIFLLENIVSYDTKGATIHCLSQRRTLFKFFKGFGDFLLARRLRKKINLLSADGVPFDLIASNLPAADRVTEKASLPHCQYLIHTSYSLEIEEFRKRGKRYRAHKKEKLYHRLYRDKDLIAVAEGIKHDLVKMGIPFRSCEVIYNPFDFNIIRDRAREESELNIEGEYLLSASAFRPVKRHDILLKAYRKLDNPPPLKLLCKGDPKLEKMIVELGLQERVEILGFVKNPYPVIQNARLLILSSEREGLPTVLIEALILGTAVVSTDCISGPSEILTGEMQRYLANVNDASALAEKISLALERYPEIENAALEKFSSKTVYRKYMELHQLSYSS